MNRFYQIAVSVLTVFSVGAVQAEIAPPHPIGKIYPEPHYVLSEYQEAAVTPDKVNVIWHGGEMPEVCKLGEKFYIASTALAVGDFYYNRNENEKALENYMQAKEVAQNDFSKDNIEKIALRINDIKARVGEETFTELENKIKNENR